MATVVVVGGGVAGLVVSTLLGADGHDVTVLERDASPIPNDADAAWASWQRRGVAQFRQAYGTPPALTALLDRELPEVNAQLEKLGALRFNYRCQLEPDLPDRELLMREERVALVARRPILELALALTAEAQPGVDIRRGVEVREYLTGPSVIDGVVHVSGVRTGTGESLSADLVIDATGRSSAIGARLADVGGRAPVESQQDNRAVYYTRYYRSRTGALPDFAGGPLFIAGQSIGLFLIPADNATWCLAVWGMAEDEALRAVRQLDVFDAVVRRFPDREQWLDAEPLTDVLPFVAGGDLTREFVVDGQPVATGIVALGDARAFTEPRLGRGTVYGAMQAVLLRDAVREHLGGSPAEMVFGWEDRWRVGMAPWLSSANSAGRTFAREMRTYIAGEIPSLDDSNRGLVLNRAFTSASRVDATVAGWLIDLGACVIHPKELFATPGAIDRIMDHAGKVEPREPPGPTRIELLDLLASH